MATTAATIFERARSIHDQYRGKHRRAAERTAAARARIADDLKAGFGNLVDVLSPERVTEALKAEYAERWYGLLVAMIDEKPHDVEPSLRRWVKLLYKTARTEAWQERADYRAAFVLDAAEEAESLLETLEAA